MADAVEVPLRASKTFVKIVLLSGWVLMMLALIATTLAPIVYWIAYPESKMPDGMREMAMLSLGFLFGTFASMLKEYMGFD